MAGREILQVGMESTQCHRQTTTQHSYAPTWMSNTCVPSLSSIHTIWSLWLKFNGFDRSDCILKWYTAVPTSLVALEALWPPSAGPARLVASANPASRQYQPANRCAGLRNCPSHLAVLSLMLVEQWYYIWQCALSGGISMHTDWKSKPRTLLFLTIDGPNDSTDLRVAKIRSSRPHY